MASSTLPYIDPVSNVNNTRTTGHAGSGATNTGGSKRPSASTPFHPPSDTSTYRDLLLFEERLKMNAEMLRRRRQRYSVFLWSFLSALALLSYRIIFLPPSNIVLLRGLQAALAVVVITLTLFFASGMYEEKVRYAHSYINHSNKALRPLNMYLNVRRPRAALLSFLPLPASLKPAPTAGPMRSQTVSPPTPTSRKGQASLGVGPFPGSDSLSTRRVSQSAQGHTVMAQIPPSTNPRGELIFSSRVEGAFEEGYKRYRAAFERRREERAREDAAAKWAQRWVKWLWWWPDSSWRPGRRAPESVAAAGGATGSEKAPAASRDRTPPSTLRSSSSISGSSSARGVPPSPRRRRTDSPARPRPTTRGTPGASPLGSRSPSPSGEGRSTGAASCGGVGDAGGAGSAVDDSAGVKAAAGSNPAVSVDTGTRDRAESYSFVDTGRSEAVGARAVRG